MKPNFALSAGIVLLLSALSLHADQPTATETKLRETLKSTVLDLRNAQNDLAAAQAGFADDEQKIKDLAAQNDALTKQAASDKAAADTALDDLGKKNKELSDQLTAYKEALAKWEAGYKLAATAAKEKEDARAKLNSQNILLQRRVDDLAAKNRNLFQIGSEILTRYKKYSLGEALAAKEPFTGLERVKLENQIQDYGDKLLDQRDAGPSAGTTAPAAPGAPSSPPPAEKKQTKQSQ
jgi:chromosome segregation ATPase